MTKTKPNNKICIKSTSFINPTFPFDYTSSYNSPTPSLSISLKMEDAEECITGLCLGLGMGGYVPKKGKQKENRPLVDLAFELCPKGEAINLNHDKVESTDSDNSNNNNGCRKKLRLSKDQSSMLENSFKLHTTLNPVYIFTFSPSDFYIYLKTCICVGFKINSMIVSLLNCMPQHDHLCHTYSSVNCVLVFCTSR